MNTFKHDAPHEDEDLIINMMNQAPNCGKHQKREKHGQMRRFYCHTCGLKIYLNIMQRDFEAS